MSRLSSFVPVLTGLIVTCAALGCSSDKAKSAPDQAPTAAAKPSPAAAPSAAAPVIKAEYAPAELWTTLAGMSRFEIMEKFTDTGLGLAATVMAVVDPPEGEFGVEVDAGEGRVIELHFGDFGAAARKQKLTVGAPIAVQKCMATNPQGNRMTLVQCALK